MTTHIDIYIYMKWKITNAWNNQPAPLSILSSLITKPPNSTEEPSGKTMPVPSHFPSTLAGPPLELKSKIRVSCGAVGQIGQKHSKTWFHQISSILTRISCISGTDIWLMLAKLVNITHICHDISVGFMVDIGVKRGETFLLLAFRNLGWIWGGVIGYP